MIITDLENAKIEVEPAHLEIGYPHLKDTKKRSQANFSGRVRADANPGLLSLIGDQPMSRNCLEAMPTCGIIEDHRGGVPNRAKVSLLPFGGCGSKKSLLFAGLSCWLPSDHFNS